MLRSISSHTLAWRRSIASRKRTAVLAVAAGLTVPAHAAGAKPLDLRLTAASAPASAAVGGVLPVRAVVRADGRAAPRTSAALYLSADARRSKDDVRLAVSARLPRLAAGHSRAFDLAATLPATQPTKSVRVILCVDDPAKVRERNERNNCRATPRPLSIVASVDPATTPSAQIAADLAAGKLTADQALEYRVFARFGDRRLPARYAGAPGDAEDDGVMREAADRWAALPKPIRKAISPYFMPPPLAQALEEDPSAAVKARPHKRARASHLDDNEPDAAPEVCASEYAKVRTWDNVPAAGGKVRIHWERSKPEDGVQAKALVGDVTRAYARYKTMLGSEPLSDANVGCYHGPDGALDIYITDVDYKAGITVPSAQSDRYDAQCDGYPGFIAAEPDHPRFKLGYTIAHEMFHAFQMAYPESGGCNDASWIDEGSATWAANLIYPTDDAEHIFSLSLFGPDRNIEIGDYDSWILFLWMEHRFGDAAIRTAYHSLPKMDSSHAVDAGIGSFRKEFLDFARAGWNQAPQASFVEWDRLDQVPFNGRDPIVPVHLFLAGEHQRTAYAKFSLGSLARDYHRYQVTDEKLREITFKNPLAGEPDARIGAYLTLADGSTRWEDWSGKERVRMCRDQPNQDVREIVLVYANSVPAAPFSAQDRGISGTPEMALKDTCDDLPWHYEVLWGQLTSHIDGFRPGNANDGLCVLDGFATHDQIDFTAAADGTGYDPSKNIIARKQATDPELSGSFAITAQRPTRSHQLTGCQGWDNGGPKTQCQATHNDDMGPFTLQADLTATSKDAQTATLQWGIPPAIAGFFDADDSVCNVGDLDHMVANDPELIESEVLMSDLGGTKPFTVTITGDKQWMGPADLGDRGTLTYHFEAKFRLQRVAADGSPL